MSQPVIEIEALPDALI